MRHGCFEFSSKYPRWHTRLCAMFGATYTSNQSHRPRSIRFVDLIGFWLLKIARSTDSYESIDSIQNIVVFAYRFVRISLTPELVNTALVQCLIQVTVSETASLSQTCVSEAVCHKHEKYRYQAKGFHATIYLVNTGGEEVEGMRHATRR
jgi:hypothetical protein